MVKPHVGTEDDRDALWSNLDVIDMIATDHAPHTVEEKSGPKPPPGTRIYEMHYHHHNNSSNT